MPKLNLKRTPQEEAAHRVRKRQRKLEKQRREFARVPAAEDSYYEDPFRAGPSDYTKIQADLEEAQFREKMAVAFEDDDRLDSLEARLNDADAAHIPMRWGGSAPKNVYKGDEYLKVDPATLDDEEYAEWVRVGMYRKTHSQEYEEAQRRKAEKAASKARQKALKEESKKLEKALDAKRQLLKRQREAQRRVLARKDYESRWKAISTNPPTDGPLYHFHEIPWPVATAHTKSLSVDDFTPDAISSFLFTSTTSDTDEAKKERKDRLRETFLRFHPDKFESRLMKQVLESDQEQVRLGVGQVVRILNDLMQN